jgi:hypothetical protein
MKGFIIHIPHSISVGPSDHGGLNSPCMEHVEEMSNAYRILIWICESKRPVEGLKCR